MKYFTIILTSILLIFSASIGLAEDYSFYFPRQDVCKHHDEAKWRAYFDTNLRTEHGFDVKYYDLYLDIDPDTQMIEGINYMTAVSTETDLQEIEIHLAELTVDMITMDDNELTYTHIEDVITIELGQSFAEGEEFTIRIDYSGEPINGMYFFPHGEISTHNEPSDARHWVPCYDDPYEKADSLTMHITLPSEWEVFANGLAREITDNGDTRTHHWHTSYPIVSYLFAFVASPDYEVYELDYITQEGDTMPMPNYLFADQYHHAEGSLDVMPSMMTILADLYGEYPFVNEKYGQASFHIFHGGMENQTITFLHSAYIDGTPNHQVWLYSHELGHQWWGDAITCGTWADIWLNEGFASYTEALYFEQLTGDVKPYILSMLNTYLHMGYEHPIYAPPPGFLFSNIVYDKAGMVLHMLRGLVGDDMFFDILAAYYDEFEFRSAITEDFHRVCEEVTGDDWNWFFDQWIYDQGYPIFDVKWDTWENGSGGYTIEASFTQLQQDLEGWQLFGMPTEIGADYGDENYELVDVYLDSTIVNYAMIDVSDEPADFAFDPHEWFVIKEAEINRFDKFEVKTIGIHDDDNDQLLERGETSDLIFGLQNHLSPAENVIVTLSTEDEDITIDNATVTYGDIDSGQLVTNDDNPFTISIAGDAPPHLVTFELTFLWNEEYEKTITVDLEIVDIMPTDVLIIDDDAGAGYETYYIDAVSYTLGSEYYYRDAHTFGCPTPEMLNNFQAVIWFTGDALENTITEAEQAALMTYLDNGGRLFLTGQGIAQDIEGSDFFTDYLHAEIDPEGRIGLKVLRGIEGDIIGDGAIISISGTGGADNQEHLVVVEPLEGAHKVFGYVPTLPGGAVRYGELGEETYQTVFFAFGFEAVTQSAPSMLTREELMLRVLTYFGYQVDVETEPIQIKTPSKTALRQNYPNPFNPLTTIEYQLPRQSELTLNIYSTTGQLVKTLYAGSQEAGTYSVVWDGTNESGQAVASGLYFYRLDTETTSQTKRMLLLK